MNQVDVIVRRIVALDAGRSTLLVAIDGCGGAGKTELAARLAHRLCASGHRTEVVHFDEFYLPSAERKASLLDERPMDSNFDWRRLRDQVLLPLRAESDVVYDSYDWASDTLKDRRTVSSGSIVLVEGVQSGRNELAPLYDFRIWVDCPREVRLLRGIQRDGEESRDRWESDWMPKEDRYVEEHRPHEHADVIVSGDG